MGRGRPGKGEGHVDGLDGPSESKARMKVILATIAGAMTVGDAAKALGLSEARFHALRQEKLQVWLDALTPRPPGRPAKQEEIEPSEVALLCEQVKELQLDLQVARARTELALTMPHVLKEEPEAEAGKKGAVKRRRAGGKPKWFDDTTNAT